MSTLGLDKPLLKPLVTLAGWTFFMQAWMYSKRIPALSDPQYGVNGSAETISSDMETKLPIRIRQVAHNYNHLHEQPTVFYAVALALTQLGDRHPYTTYGAWGYVGVRVIHSLYQALVNDVMTRFAIFNVSSVALVALTARLARLVF